MKRLLLLGAGFSCNWRGWNASQVNDYLPILPALRADRHVLQVLRRTANKGGFESALAEIQDDYEKSPTPKNKVHLDTLQSAITTTFLDMEVGFASRADWNFRHTVEYKIAHFLSTVSSNRVRKSRASRVGRRSTPTRPRAMPVRAARFRADGDHQFGDNRPYNRANLRSAARSALVVDRSP
jgi:hypothetical protein